ILGEIPSVGTGQQPSLEKILSLKPDLILGYEWQRSYYSQLSKIAPTVMIDISTGVKDFKRDFKRLAEILGKSDQVEGILAEYNEKIQKFRQRFGEKLKSKTISLLAFFSGNFHVIGPETLVHAQIMREAGIQFIPAYKNLKRNTQYNMSLEALPDWDADFLFIGLIDKNPLEDLEPVFKQPLWSKLRAVRNDQVYILEKYFSGGPIGATQFVEDLYEYFSSKL
ncbi:MAG: iron-siderophore ABC transporter substrate-binding protein, partial [Pseudomonadota bacterium]